MKTLIIIFILLTSCPSINEKKAANDVQQNTYPDSSKLENIGKLRSKDSHIGDVFIRKMNNDIFTELYVINKGNDTLYYIQKSGLRNKKGTELSMDENDFLGYHLVLIKDEYFEITFLSGDGTRESDIITIKYNEEKNLMELLKTP